MNYLRDWSFTITPYDLDLSGERVLNRSRSRVVRELKILFNIRNTALGDPHLGNFQVYNIGPETKALLSTSYCRVEFQAGWQYGTKAMVFEGDITNAYEIRQGPDLVWNLWARDDGFAASQSTAGIPSFESTASAMQIIQRMVDATDTVTSLGIYGTVRTQLENFKVDGYSFERTFKNELTDLLQSMEMQWVLSGGVLYIFSALDDSRAFSGDPTRIVTVSQDTGLLSRPVMNWYSIQFNHMLDARFKPGVIIKVAPQSVEYQYGNEFYVPLDPRSGDRLDGTFRIMEVKHTGDTRGDKWGTFVNAFDKAQADG